MGHRCGPVAGWQRGRQARPCCCSRGGAGVRGRPSRPLPRCQAAAVTAAAPPTSPPRPWRDTGLTAAPLPGQPRGWPPRPRHHRPAARGLVEPTASPTAPVRWGDSRRQHCCQPDFAGLPRGEDSCRPAAADDSAPPLPPKPTLRFAVTTTAPDSHRDGRSVPAVAALPLEGRWDDGLAGSAGGRVTSRPDATPSKRHQQWQGCCGHPCGCPALLL